MNKIGKFFRDIFGITLLQEVLLTLKETRNLLDGLKVSISSMPDIVDKNFEKINSTLQSLQFDLDKIPSIVNDSLQELSKSMSLVNENMKNLYAFSEGIRVASIKPEPATIQRMEIPETRSMKPSELYGLCIQSVGKSFSDNKQYGSAETVNRLVEQLAGVPISSENSDSMMYWFLNEFTTRFEKISVPGPGDIIISPTGKGKDPEAIGCVGIVGDDGKVFTPDTSTGNLSDKATIDEWVEHYQKQGGFPVEYFRIK